MNLTLPQIALISAIATYTGGFIWCFLSSPGLAKKAGLLILIAAVASIIAFFTPRDAAMTLDWFIRHVYALAWLIIPFAPFLAAAVLIWLAGLHSTRKLRHFAHRPRTG